eukprot:TRINITY_DN3133_c0_g1_i1.p1 TRINITY_DN3133_c0_g1~~TRINITY_DN3133_c0_g1_i1.p1  ORF type:complete len:393 (+),score=80.52 TRINITY_DN3133_c0_g1_i1:85-1179(+)
MCIRDRWYQRRVHGDNIYQYSSRKMTQLHVSHALLLLACVLTHSAAFFSATLDLQETPSTLNITGKYPIALFHGIGDFCLQPGTARFANNLRNMLNVYVRCIEIGDGPLASWFTPLSFQIHSACETIRNDPNFDQDFAIVGLSQGALTARAILQTCNTKGKVRRFLSIGGPQMGLSRFPRCMEGPLCFGIAYVINFLNNIIGLGQDIVAPLDYFRFLPYGNGGGHGGHLVAELNNEGSYKNGSYIEKIEDLERMMLVMFEQDDVLYPKETAWFWFWDETGQKVVSLDNSKFYTEDWLGIRRLIEGDRIDFVSLPGGHLRFNTTVIEEKFAPLLAGLQLFIKSMLFLSSMRLASCCEYSPQGARS